MRKKESEWKRQLPGGAPDFEVRTDLAVEEGERFPGDGGEISGVSLRKWRESNSDICMTEVKILNEHGAGIMGKPVGTYLTLEADALAKELSGMDIFGGIIGYVTEPQDKAVIFE